MVQASLAVSVEDIFLNSSLVTALNKAFNALLLKFAALIFASSQSVGASFGLVQPISIACHTFLSKDYKKALMRICYVVIVPLSDARLPSTWLIVVRILIHDFKTPTEKIVGCKVLQFIHSMKIKKMLGHKTLRCKYTATSSRERNELGQEPCLRSQFAWTKFTQCLCNLCTILRLLKQSCYMSRVSRKEDPKTYSRIPRKSFLNSEILKPR